MRLINLSKIGITFGFLLFIATEVRYFILTQDLDKAIYFGIISLLIMVISFIWSKVVYLANTLDDVETYLADLNKENDKN